MNHEFLDDGFGFCVICLEHRKIKALPCCDIKTRKQGLSVEGIIFLPYEEELEK